MDDVLDNLTRALAEAWERYRGLEHPDPETDGPVVEALARVVDQRLSDFYGELLGDRARLRSILVTRLEETLFGAELRTHDALMVLVPRDDEDLERARRAETGLAWRLEPTRGQLGPKEVLEAQVAFAPPGTRLELGEDDDPSSVSRFDVVLDMDALQGRDRVRVPAFLPGLRSWSDTGQTPEVVRAASDAVDLPLPEVFGAERGQWAFPDAPLAVRWWTEPGVAEDGGVLGPHGVTEAHPLSDPSTQERESARLLWAKGRQQGVGRFVVNRLDLELSLDAFRAIDRFRGAHELRIQLRVPPTLGAPAPFSDHAKVRLGPTPKAVAEAYRPLFGKRFIERAAPGNWRLVQSTLQLRLDNVLITVPPHEPEDEGAIPRPRLERPVQRRNLVRAALRPWAAIVTAEDLTDAVDDMLHGIARVDPAYLRGVPTWLESDAELRRQHPELDGFAGFVWVVPLVEQETGGRAERLRLAALSMVNQRVPIGVKVVFESAERRAEGS